MRYLGSKTSLLDQIANVIETYRSDGVFCDPFGGIGTVGSFMKAIGYRVITGDLLYFAHCFQVAFIENDGEAEFLKVKHEISINTLEELEQYLNTLPSKEGWLVYEYAQNRSYFTVENARKIQACLDCIQEWEKMNILEKDEYEILIASLIQSFDKVANTAGTYYAFLKDYYRKARNVFEFQLIRPTPGKHKCKSFYLDANHLVKNNACDILYLDPPYNERKYERYYHLPENIANGIVPLPKGKSGVYVPVPKNSLYNDKSKATKAFADLINDADAGCIIFHYTDNGIINIDDAKSILRDKGVFEEFYFDCKGYSTTSNIEKSKHHIMKVVI